MNRYDLDSLIWEMNEANRKSTEASDAYNKEVARITKRQRDKALKGREKLWPAEEIVLETIIRGLKEKSPKLEELASKQKFFSSEVVRISALLQGILAYDELSKRGYQRSA